jgi:hypothetical protein
MNAAAKNEAARKVRVRKQAVKPQPAELASREVPETDKELAARLLDTPTIADKSWAPARGATRNAGESRAQFIRRVLLGKPS